jgi:hypothetical protein
VLDKKNGNTLWAGAIANDVCPVWCVLILEAWGDIPLPGHQFIKCHMIFDVKIEDLRCKARMDSGDQMNQLKSCRR